MALGLTLGVVMAVSGGGTQKIQQSALGATATPTVSGAAATTPAAAATTDVADLALTAPADAAGNLINLAQTPAQALVSMNCTLTVPANPLTAAGLATPWQLGDGCSMANFATEGAFVEATILAPNGTLQVYNPLVITAGTTPATTPIPPTIAAGSTVIIDTGFNGNALVLQGAGATQGLCIDAFGQSIMNQTAACNAAAFYTAANAQIAAGTLAIPLTGTDGQGAPCETTTSFSLIDQDQSDNVVSAYLLNANGQTAQNTAANAAAMAGSTKITNGSDDALVSEFVDPALGCTPFTAPDNTAAGGTSPSEALNNLSAAKNPPPGTTVALNPVNDPQLLVANAFSIGKTNAYRVLVDQTPIAAGTDPNANAATYCQNMVNIQPAKLKLDMGMMSVFTTPVAAVGNNLANFMAGRLFASFANLNCQNFGLVNPVTLMTNGGVAVGATFNLNPQVATVTGTTTGTGTATAAPTPTPTTTTACVPAQMVHHHRVARHCVTTSTHHRGFAGKGFRGPGRGALFWGNYLPGGRDHT
jgi:hypothetical protein